MVFLLRSNGVEARVLAIERLSGATALHGSAAVCLGTGPHSGTLLCGGTTFFAPLLLHFLRANWTWIILIGFQLLFETLNSRSVAST
jgi:hypothetical protein